MESQRGGVLRSDNRGKWSKDGEGKGARSYRVASAERCKRCAKGFGLANYYRWFVKDFAKIAKLLHEMTRKETK